MSRELEKQIQDVIAELPIAYPAQLYLRKGSVYVESYDPVHGITVNDHSIDIIYGEYTFSHSFADFDRIYIVPNGDEPVELKQSKPYERGEA